jgi:hypothetical protein
MMMINSMTFARNVAVLLTIIGIATVAPTALAHNGTSSSAQSSAISEQEAYEIAKDAYVYAYPLMLT